MKGLKTGGRRKGTPNKVTADARNVFAQLLEANLDRAQELWNRVADENPLRALELLAKWGEFVIPKPVRVEATTVARPPLSVREMTDEELMEQILEIRSSNKEIAGEE